MTREGIRERLVHGEGRERVYESGTYEVACSYHSEELRTQHKTQARYDRDNVRILVVDSKVEREEVRSCGHNTRHRQETTDTA